MPKALAKGSPLVLAMHGSGENGAQMHAETGYAFERLERGFAVLYPNAHEGDWNACNTVGNYSANKLNIDDGHARNQADRRGRRRSRRTGAVA